jgi:hypothetical protein
MLVLIEGSKVDSVIQAEMRAVYMLQQLTKTRRVDRTDLV